MRKLRKNVHENIHLTLSLIFSLALFLSLALFHTDTHAQTRKSKISLLASFGSPLVFPCAKRNFLKLLDGSLPSSFLKADSRMEANYSEANREMRIAVRARAFLIIIPQRRDLSCRSDFIERIARRRITLSVEARIPRSLAGEYRID